MKVRLLSVMGIVLWSFISGVLAFSASEKDFVEIHCDTPGTLQVEGQALVAPYLKVSGNIDARDFETLKAVTINVTNTLDLSDAVICEYYGTNGSIQDLSSDWIIGPPTNYLYPANTFPRDAFVEVRNNSLHKYLRGSYSLNRLILPATLTGFMEKSLNNNYVLTDLEVPQNSTTLTEIDGLIYSFDRSTLLAIPPAYYGIVNIEESVKRIAPYAFYDTKPAAVIFNSGKMPIIEDVEVISAAYIMAPNPWKYEELYPAVDCISEMPMITVASDLSNDLLSAIGNLGYTRSEVRSIKVTGEITFNDFNQLLQLPNLHDADLSEATVARQDKYLDITINNPSLIKLDFPVFKDYLSLEITADCRLFGELDVPEGVEWFGSLSPRFTSVSFPSTLYFVDDELFNTSIINFVDFSKCINVEDLEGLRGAGALQKVQLPPYLKTLRGFAGPIEDIVLPQTLTTLSSEGNWHIDNLTLPASLTNFSVSSFPFLKTLNTEEAVNLKYFSGLSNVPYLKDLDLSHNPVQNIVDLFHATHTFDSSTSQPSFRSESGSLPAYRSQILDDKDIKEHPTTVRDFVVVGGTVNPAPSIVGIENLKLPSTLTSFTGLNNCRDLKNLDLMQCFRLSEIDCLYDCPSLESLSLPESISTVKGLFNCNNLTKVTCASSRPPRYNSDIQYSHLDFNKINLFIAKGDKGAYLMADNWEKCQIEDDGYRVSIDTSKIPEESIDVSSLLLSGAGLYHEGEEAILSAVSKDPFVCHGWIVNGNELEGNLHRLTVEDNVLAFPLYQIDMQGCDITFEIEVPEEQTVRFYLNADQGKIYGNGYLWEEMGPDEFYAEVNRVLPKGKYSFGVTVGPSFFTGISFFCPKEYENDQQSEDAYRVTSFNLNYKEGLTVLYPFNFQMEELDLSGATGLVDLQSHGGSNKIKTLNITGCTALTNLILTDSQIETFISSDEPLDYLDLSNNQLTSVDLTELHELASLNLSNNMLSEFKMDTSKCTYLNLDNNPMAFSTLTQDMYDIYKRNYRLSIPFKPNLIMLEETGILDLSSELYPPNSSSITEWSIDGEPQSLPTDGLLSLPKGSYYLNLYNEAFPNLVYYAYIENHYASSINEADGNRLEVISIDKGVYLVKGFSQEGTAAQLNIYASDGRVLKQVSSDKAEVKIDLREYPTGVYCIRLVSDSQDSKVIKVVR